MKIFFVIIVYIFFVFLINYQSSENFQQTCPQSCLQQINNQNQQMNAQAINSINTTQQNTNVNIQQLATQVSNISMQVNDIDRKATNALLLATQLDNNLKTIKNELTNAKASIDENEASGSADGSSD